MDWLVDQETFDVVSVSCLEDCDLIRLLALMERARECMADGISFEDAGLVRTASATSTIREIRSSRSLLREESLAAVALDRMPYAKRSPLLYEKEPPF